MVKMKVRFPSGKAGSELRFYMCEDWPKEKDCLGRDLLQKCLPGKSAELNQSELERLISECANAIDIKIDHIDFEGWGKRYQNILVRFKDRLTKAKL